MFQFAFFWVILASAAGQLIRVLQPKSLEHKIRSIEGSEGYLSTSLSTFGTYVYDEEVILRVIRPSGDDDFGCDTLKRPEDINPDIPFAFILKRGHCSIAQKANAAAKAGALTILVDSNEDKMDTLRHVPKSDPKPQTPNPKPQTPNPFGHPSLFP